MDRKWRQETGPQEFVPGGGKSAGLETKLQTVAKQLSSFDMT